MKLHRWNEFPPRVREHLRERLRDRRVTVADLDKLRVWVESQPEVPAGDWFKDFGSFKICGNGPDPSTFLTAEQKAWGKEIDGESENMDA